ncbi:MAG: phytanoyl-CoA dioxygenase family protein [Planctomycetota bacterium]|nr:phytanoyl-CoA dioxygenase family protein [Planctomycetota bacterium]
MRLPPRELQSGRLDPETLATAVELVRTDGYVVFEGVLDAAFVARLREAFFEVFLPYVEDHPQNRGANRYQMHLPFREPFSDPRLIANPFALPIVEALLGADCVCQYFASDTPLPGSDFQAVHSDIHALFPESDLVVPAYGLVLNVNLVDFREENGPLEIWPGGTHRMPPNAELKKLAPLMQSRKVLMPAGSVLLRDLRAWHRGTPNRSNEPRPNLALIYARSWLKTHYPPIAIPKAAYAGLSERARKLFRLERIEE